MRNAMWVAVVVLLFAASCGDGSEDAASPTPTPLAAVIPDDPTPTPIPAEVDASAEPAEEPTAAEPPPEPVPTEESDAAPVEEPAEATPAPEPATPPAEGAGQGSVQVTLDDGRVYEAATECSVVDTTATGWSFAFEGLTAEGVEIEGFYDESDPGFAVLFLIGPDALNGEDVFLTNDDGGDDILETTTGGNVWEAVVLLADDAGGQVTAQLAASCN